MACMFSAMELVITLCLVTSFAQCKGTSDTQVVHLQDTKDTPPLPGFMKMPEYTVPHPPELPEPAMHHRRRRKKCEDKRNHWFCEHAQVEGWCDKRKHRKRCRKTCGDCDDDNDCKDFTRNCIFASTFTCSQYWFALGCKKSCNLCKPEQTTFQPTTATEPEKECNDLHSRCQFANKYTCAIFWYQRGCQKSCGKCETKTTPNPPTTVTEPTTVEPTTTERTTKLTTTAATTTSLALETTNLITEVMTVNTTTECQNQQEFCVAMPMFLCGIQSVKDECQKTCGNCNKEMTTTEPYPIDKTTEQTASTSAAFLSTATLPDGSGSEVTTTEAKLCVDSDQKNCHVWESLGLCYNPQFMDDMMELCPLSCGICTPDLE